MTSLAGINDHLLGETHGLILPLGVGALARKKKMLWIRKGSGKGEE
jgi:hypothetical protein